MAATELLDFNQVVEQSSTNGDKPSSSGGLMSWNFRCDPNLAWDPSQSYFAMDITLATKTGGAVDAQTMTYPTWSKELSHIAPDNQDFYPFFPLRAFSSMTHIIDGVTVAHSNQPYADKIMQEKYLHDTSLSNYGNFESLLVARAIDDFDTSHNLFMADTRTPQQDVMSDGYEWVKNEACMTRIRNADSDGATYTVLFQPPFDLWTKHQRISGGNHQIQLDLKSSVSKFNNDGSLGLYSWGDYFITPAAGMSNYLLSETIIGKGDIGYYALGANAAIAATGLVSMPAAYDQGDENTVLDAVNALIATRATAAYANTTSGTDKSFFGQFTKGVGSWAQYGGTSPTVEDTVKMRQLVYNQSKNMAVEINSIRLLRRMVRFTIERPIGMEEFNCTEMAFFTGTPSTSSMTQNFLLPSSTFGIAFYWRDAANSYFDVIDDYQKFTAPTSAYAGGAPVPLADIRDQSNVTWKRDYNRLGLQEFYFTYGGQTYPAQRISNIYGNSTSGVAPGSYKMHAITHMLQGVMNTDQERYNTSFGGAALMNRMDGSSFFFPVAKHNNSDNSDLQVTWSGAPTNVSIQYVRGPIETALMASLVVVAFYDSRVELAYNAANQLEKVTKTEWK